MSGTGHWITGEEVEDSGWAGKAIEEAVAAMVRFTCIRPGYCKTPGCSILFTFPGTVRELE